MRPYPYTENKLFEQQNPHLREPEIRVFVQDLEIKEKLMAEHNCDMPIYVNSSNYSEVYGPLQPVQFWKASGRMQR